MHFFVVDLVFLLCFVFAFWCFISDLSLYGELYIAEETQKELEVNFVDLYMQLFSCGGDTD